MMIVVVSGVIVVIVMSVVNVMSVMSVMGDCDYERRCEPRCQPGHFFLRRKLPLPRPTREGCTALEAICCLVDAAERGASLE